MNTPKELVDYFIEQTNQRFGIIEQKLDRLFAFKWQIIGGAGALSAVIAFLVSFLTILLTK